MYTTKTTVFKACFYSLTGTITVSNTFQTIFIALTIIFFLKFLASMFIVNTIKALNFEDFAFNQILVLIILKEKYKNYNLLNKKHSMQKSLLSIIILMSNNWAIYTYICM